MIDLHTHTFFSDGALVPSELVRRAEDKGYKAIALTDHVDASNIDIVVPRIVKVAEELNRLQSVKVIAGLELTHVPPASIKRLADAAREMGAQLVVVHGETPVEPVKEGTNLAAIEAGVDVLAHPGLITRDEVRLAVKKGILLEITTRKGHSLGNGIVAKLALEENALLIVNTDTHAPGDLVTEAFAKKVLLCAGIPEEKTHSIFQNSVHTVQKVL
ncbi:MAG: histidinol phosphate phosphatase domain-containing protein [Candidatus Schekmanbacteria bacterium]|nr:histidinol phosphate phosphatase domain-containing protein [Candidatus Schekmanbacteria bacterium]